MPEHSSNLARECSPFLDDLITRNPAWLEELDGNGRLVKPSPPDAVSLAQSVEEHGLDKGLRLFRNQEMLRIVWRELSRLAPLTETMSDLSRLAEVCLNAANDYHYEKLIQRFGEPRDDQGKAQCLVIISLGKLGGNELNLSSDIDIVFTFPKGGECNGRGKLSNVQFFTKLAQLIVRSLSEVTEHGFCFRVDTRLRPFGESGPLVSSFGAMEQYYQREGRDWERYALIKARTVTGDKEAGTTLLSSLKPFVYRRYIDFGAVETLHEMYRSLREDSARRDRENDVKRGRGGIREIEFLVQAFQLLRGGREPQLQSTSLLETLLSLGELEILPALAVQSLQQAYEFLRRLENTLQALHDQQTHTLPKGDDLERVARAMRFSDPDTLNVAITETREIVINQIDACFPERKEQKRPDTTENHWIALKAGDWPADEALRSVFEGFMSSLTRLSLSNRAAKRLDEFMPALLLRLQESAPDTTVTTDVLNLVLAICRRSAYLSLLVQNPSALDRMLALFTKSDWVANTVIHHPALLDELIDPGLGKLLPDEEEMKRAGKRSLISKQDTEGSLLALNHVKLAFSLRVAVAELENTLSPQQVQKSLSQLAGVIIQTAHDLALKAVIEKHGKLPGKGLGVIAYGSLGAQELSYGSDLDLIFLYEKSDSVSDGDRPIEAERFYTAVVRRLLSLLTSSTASGRLYEVDTRLRPNGRSGLLVSSLSAFEKYQKNEAWVWELQALTRARHCAGNEDIGETFNALRAEILSAKQDPALLRVEVQKMRKRLREAQPSADELKHAEGGLIDIGFVAQLGILTIGSTMEAVIPSGTLEQLQSLKGAHWLSEEQAEALSQAFLSLTEARHLSLLSRKFKGSKGIEFSALEICRPYLLET